MEEDTNNCEICAKPLLPNDYCLFDISLGIVHAGCCGPERESYVNLETGEPIGPDDPLPVPFKYAEET